MQAYIINLSYDILIIMNKHQDASQQLRTQKVVLLAKFTISLII